MYEEFYKLDRAPFDTTPDPTFFFMSDGHQEALAALVYGIDRRKGFISMIGEVGTGKTTVLRAYIESEHVQNTRIIYLFNPRVSYEDLLLMVLRELRVEIPDGETKRVDLLHRVLVNEYKNGNNVVLIVDEAQNIPPETLESMRMLSNLETSSEKLIQIVLSGQPELDEILNSNRLRQLRQRIAVKVKLEVLSRAEAADYVRYRLRRAGGDEGVFTKDAIDWVVRYTGGNPRSINVLCDNALITGYGYQQFPISTPIIKEIAKDFDIKSLSTQHGTKSDSWLRTAGAVLAVAGVAGLVYLWASYDKDSVDDAQTLAVDQGAAQTTEDSIEPAQDSSSQSEQAQAATEESNILAETEATREAADAAIADDADETDGATTTETTVQAEASAETGTVQDTEVSVVGGVVEESELAEAQPVVSSTGEGETADRPVAVGTVVVVDEGEAAAGNEQSEFVSVIQTDAGSASVAESAPQPSTPETQSDDLVESGSASTDSGEEPDGNRVLRASSSSDPAELVSPAVSTSELTETVVQSAESITDSQPDSVIEDIESTTVVGVADNAGVVIIDGVRQPQSEAELLPTISVDDTANDIESSVETVIDNSDIVAPSTGSAAANETEGEAENVAIAEVNSPDKPAQQAVRIVNSGDNLWDMTREVYGRVNERIVARVMESNPDLVSASAIYVGQKIIFPEL